MNPALARVAAVRPDTRVAWANASAAHRLLAIQVTAAVVAIRARPARAASEGVAESWGCNHSQVKRIELPMERPKAVTAIAVTLFLASGYLAIVAAIKLVAPEAVSLSLGAPLLHGFEISGPYGFLVAATVGTLTGIGLFRLDNVARRIGMVLSIVGVVLLIPKLSADAAELSLRLLTAGFAVMVRVAIAWYLWQGSTAEKFH